MRAFQGTAVLAVAMSLFILGACASDEARRDAPVRDESSSRGSALPTGFVELGEVARRSGARYAPAAGASRARLEVGGRRAEISGDSRVAYVDGELVLMPAIPERVGSAIYIDERFARRLEGWADLARRRPPAPALAPAPAPAPVSSKGPSRGGLSGFRVVVDAGHGGKDPGALGGGLREKDVVLDIARRLTSRLESMGAEVTMTRDGDRFLELEDRAAVSNGRATDVFVSVHVNSSSNRSAKGIEVFRATRRSASHRSDKIGASRDLAESIYAELQRVSPHGDRGVKDSPGFRVLKLNENPAVLLELGFVSNPEEARLLADPSYRARLAEAIAAGLEAYAS